MNKVILLGNLVKDLEVTVTKNDKLVGKTTLAVNEGYGDNKKTTFVNLVIFGERCDKLQQYLLKGTGVLIDGKLDINNVQDKDGNWSTYVTVIVNELQITKFMEASEDVQKSRNSKTNSNKRGGRRQCLWY